MLIVGPRQVCRRASLFHPAIMEMPEVARKREDAVHFSRAMNEYVKECSKAIDTRHRQENVDYEAWKAISAEPLGSWPGP